MAECIIARGGRTVIENGGGLPPVIAGYCQVVANVYDGDGNPFPDVLVCCKDGNTWYNYHSNDKGQILFVTNSGSLNITARNYSSENGYTWIDQKPPATMNIDAPVTTSKFCNINFSTYKDNRQYTSVVSYGKFKFRSTNSVYVICGGAGGGGGGSYYQGEGPWVGGAGGAKNAGTVQINKDTIYNMYIGQGGRGSTTYSAYGGTGGSTSCCGVTATGGGGASASGVGIAYTGNAGGGGGRNPSNNQVTMNGTNGYGGAGGSYSSSGADRAKGGSPNGGRGAYRDSYAWSASPGGIGGGGGAGYAGGISNQDDTSSSYWGGNGGSGIIWMNNFN